MFVTDLKAGLLVLISQLFIFANPCFADTIELTEANLIQINEIIAAIVAHYSSQGRDFVDVYLPEHAFKHGILQIVISEAYIANIEVKGN